LTELANNGLGYTQLIWLLEKVSKASLEWHEHEQPPAAAVATPKQGGLSPEAERRLEAKLASMN